MPRLSGKKPKSHRGIRQWPLPGGDRQITWPGWSHDPRTGYAAQFCIGKEHYGARRYRGSSRDQQTLAGGTSNEAPECSGCDVGTTHCKHMTRRAHGADLPWPQVAQDPDQCCRLEGTFVANARRIGPKPQLPRTRWMMGEEAVTLCGRGGHTRLATRWRTCRDARWGRLAQRGRRNRHGSNG